MTSKYITYTETKYFDSEQFNVFHIRLRIDSIENKPVSFALVYTSIIDNIPREILRIDGNVSERIHVHYFFKRPTEKQYHNKELNYETISGYIDQILEHWQWYLAQYKEKYI